MAFGAWPRVAMAMKSGTLLENGYVGRIVVGLCWRNVWVMCPICSMNMSVFFILLWRCMEMAGKIVIWGVVET